MHYTVVIFQMDAVTGPKNFLADLDSDKKALTNEPALIEAPGGMPGIDESEIVEVWGRVEGNYNYKAKSGKEETVPKITAVSLELKYKGRKPDSPMRKVREPGEASQTRELTQLSGNRTRGT